MSKGAKYELAQGMAIKLDLPVNTCIDAISYFVDNLPHLLQKEGQVHIRGLGTFTVQTRKDKTKLPGIKTNKVYKIPPYKYVSFKQSVKFRRAVNA